eukprot:4318880-Lingulodinium_polyedra.AAC.1
MALLQNTSRGPTTAAATRPVTYWGLPFLWVPASFALMRMKSSQSTEVRPWCLVISTFCPSGARTTTFPSAWYSIATPS